MKNEDLCGLLYDSHVNPLPKLFMFASLALSWS